MHHCSFFIFAAAASTVSLLLSPVALPRISPSATMSTEKNMQKSAAAGVAAKKIKTAHAKRDQPDEAEAPSLPLELEAMDVLLKFHATSAKHKLLDIRECGRLSIASKTVAGLFDDNGIWKNIFDQTAAMGKTYQRPKAVTSAALYDYDGQHFSNEDGLLDCFRDPDERIVERLGYKKLASCLRSKSCFTCGKICGVGHPFLFERMCGPCSREPERTSTALVDKYDLPKYLLSEEDVEDSVSAKFTTKMFPAGSDRESRSDEDLINVDMDFITLAEIKAAQLKKFGDKEEIDKALGDEQLEDDDDVSLVPSLPIGTVYQERSWSRGDSRKLLTKMAHSYGCKKCERSGALADILMHERLEHGTDLQSSCFPDMQLQTNSGPEGRSRELVQLLIPGIAGELFQLFHRATFKYESAEIEEERVRGFTFETRKRNCTVLFDVVDERGMLVDKVTMAVDYSQGCGGCCDWGTLSVCSQLGSEKVPIMLLQLGFREDQDDTREADSRHFVSAIEKLGLNNTSAGQLLVAHRPLGQGIHCQSHLLGILTRSIASGRMSQVDSKANFIALVNMMCRGFLRQSICCM